LEDIGKFAGEILSGVQVIAPPGWYRLFNRNLNLLSAGACAFFIPPGLEQGILL